jgi:hypothetical protein
MKFLTPSNSRIAGGVALLLLVAYLLPWDAFTDGTGTSRLSYLAASFASGMLFSGFIPFSYLAIDLAIAFLSALVVLKALFGANVPRQIVIGLGVLALFSETYDFAMRVLVWGMPVMTYFQGMGLGRYLFYICVIALIAVGLGARASAASQDSGPEKRLGRN